jgi:hypothetical protein
VSADCSGWVLACRLMSLSSVGLQWVGLLRGTSLPSTLLACLASIHVLLVENW